MTTFISAGLIGIENQSRGVVGVLGDEVDVVLADSTEDAKVRRGAVDLSVVGVELLILDIASCPRGGVGHGEGLELINDWAVTITNLSLIATETLVVVFNVFGRSINDETEFHAVSDCACTGGEPRLATSVAIEFCVGSSIIC